VPPRRTGPLDTWFDTTAGQRLVLSPDGSLAARLLEVQPPTATDAGRLTVEAEALGDGTGRPGQQALLPGAPLVAASLQVLTVEEGRLRAWALRPDFDASSARDAHAVLDPVETRRSGTARGRTLDGPCSPPSIRRGRKAGTWTATIR
jgi:hypothetical protein